MATANTPPVTTASKPTSTATASPAARTHTIQVGPKEDPHGYVPHSLDASRLESPLYAGRRGLLLFWNDFEEVHGQVVGTLPTWNWTVANYEPTFFYCTGRESCIVNGMVGVINPNSTRTWESQHKAALEAPYMLLPGQPMPAEGDEGANTGTNPGTTATHSTSTTPSPSNSDSLSGGAIAGIVVGAVSFVIILCVLLFLLGRNHVYKKWLSHSQDGSTRETRTARWALSTSAGTAAGKSEGDTASTGIPGHISVPGASPSLHETGTGSVNTTGTGMGHGTMSSFTPMEYALPRSGVYSIHDNAFGTSSPSLGQYSQHFQQQQQQAQQNQPYWIWDQSIQPQHMAVRKAEPSELAAETPRR
ncbi:hypothetical protein BJY04DRAFT_215207 [Aspergillus karnatakaensis]|uniref:EGFR-like transmembrane domain-containing protein n=1 Tax=Aspergillus karnatakaensis TaxID=1810916 RepID=UPI003CCDFD75